MEAIRQIAPDEDMLADFDLNEDIHLGELSMGPAAQYHDLLHKSTPSEIHTFYYNIHSSKRIEECPKFAASGISGKRRRNPPH